MATVLMTWELGAGLGHMTRMREVGQRLVARGHRVIAVLRDLYRAGPVFDGSGMQLLQAPFKQKPTLADSSSSNFALNKSGVVEIGRASCRERV